MTDRDGDDLTDEELVEMWKRGEPVRVRQPSDAPAPRGADERPKRTSGVATNLSFAPVQQVGLANGLVDNKVAAIDATWSGLRFVRRVDDRSR